MKKRQRKKWLKQHGEYVNPRDTWALDYTIAEFALPRLKLYKEKTLAYPGTGEADTPEKWDAILDKIMFSFELILNEDTWEIGDPEYDYLCYISEDMSDEDREKSKEVSDKYFGEVKRREQIIQEGLDLFAKWFRHLGW